MKDLAASMILEEEGPLVVAHEIPIGLLTSALPKASTYSHAENNLVNAEQIISEHPFTLVEQCGVFACSLLTAFSFGLVMYCISVKLPKKG